MSNIAIRVENLSKRYRIGRKEETHDTMVGTLTGFLRQPIHNLRRLRRLTRFGSDGGDAEDIIWALKDVSFEVKQGEVLGIIGRNGAGKSTLLKILSRITKPTGGRAIIDGRVASLLEVGTGFHGELTGRENVYLNGTILGMRKVEIDRKFDEIVAFSGVEQFIDTPVKYYSSGMQVRLAFSVAAHLEPEILLIDEVLAVGDAPFQKKCLRKMDEVRQEGRTVFFVSHNMASILNLCRRVILLEEGRVVMDDDPQTVVVHYLEAGKGDVGAEVVWANPAQAPGDDVVRLHAVRVLSEDDVPTTRPDICKEICIQIEYWNLRPGARFCPIVVLTNPMGEYVLASLDLPSASLTVDPLNETRLPTGLFRTTCCIPANLLNDVAYTLTAGVDSNVAGDGRAVADDVIRFHGFDSGAMRKEYSKRSWPGFVRPRLGWHTECLESVDEAVEHAS